MAVVPEPGTCLLRDAFQPCLCLTVVVAKRQVVNRVVDNKTVDA